MINNIPNRLIFDVLEDRIFDEIVKARDEQAASNPSLFFNIGREEVIEKVVDNLPFVNIRFVNEIDENGSSTIKHQEMELVYDIEMFTTLPSKKSNEGLISSDFRSVKRLFFLAAQVKSLPRARARSKPQCAGGRGAP